MTLISVASYDTEKIAAVPYLDSIVIHNIERQELVVFSTNKHQSETIDVAIDTDFDLGKVIESTQMTGYDIKAVNGPHEQKVIPKTMPVDHIAVRDGHVIIKTEPLSWNMTRVEIKK